MQTSRTERQRADTKKAHGVHYTPPELADFLAASGLAALDGDLNTVLDPACGGGELLHAVFNNLGEFATPKFIALDRDESAVGATAERLSALGVQFEARAADFMNVAAESRPQLELFETLMEEPTIGEVDLAIGNPPYVRTQTMGQEQVGRLAAKYRIRGRVDLYMAFAFGMTDVLRAGGVLAFLCSNRFLTTKGGQSLKELLLREYEIESITDFGDTRLFEAAVLPAVVIARKRPTRAAARTFVSMYALEGRAPSKPVAEFASVPQAAFAAAPGTVKVGEGLFVLRSGTLGDRVRPENAWTLQDAYALNFFATLGDTNLTFADLGKIRVGVKTTADKVFIRDDWECLESGPPPEKELLYPLINHHVIERWAINEPKVRLLYPHRDEGGRARAVDLEKYPCAAAYLDAHRGHLEARKYVIEGGRNWFEIWVPQKPHLWGRPKVVFPDIAEKPRFAVDVDGRIVNGDCYWISCEEEDLAVLLAAVGNSALAREFYDLSCGNQLYSGRRRFMTQYVERFPVPDPSSPEAQKIVALGRQAIADVSSSFELDEEIESLVRRSLGFEEVAR